MSQGWRSQAAPGSLRPVYGAQFPPLGQAVGGPETGTASSSPAKSNGDKAAAENARFRDFAARVEDAWEVEDESLVQRTAEQVLANHRTAAAAHPRRGHPAHSHLNLAHNALPSQHSKQRAMQLLATQKEPLPGTAVPLGGYEHEPGTSCRGLYPNLPQLNADLINREGGKGVPDSGGPQGPGPASIRALQRNSSSGEKVRKGIRHKLRPRAWKLLLGYTPLAGNKDAVLHRKRAEYWDYVSQYEDHHADTFRQIHIDIPRMCPLIPLFQQKRVQEIFERILYIWAIRHPACGYVQGINDLVTPFFVVFLSDNLSDDVEVSTYLVSNMEQEVINAIEADSFWCVSALLDTIQDNYTFAQPGIQHKIAQLSHLMSRVDRSLDEHLEKMQVEYLQFAFRWMNNLLMRELPLGATIRLWDTYLCESGGGGRAFADFHVYVCAAFLRVWSKQLQQHKDFQGVMLLLQNLPTAGWRDREICELTADAFSLMTLFAGSKNHLTSQT